MHPDGHDEIEAGRIGVELSQVAAMGGDADAPFPGQLLGFAEPLGADVLSADLVALLGQKDSVAPFALWCMVAVVG